MKPTLLKILALALLALLARYTTLQAQPGKAGHPARREVRAYYQAQVLPALRRQRQLLEPQLSAPDRAQLATYRTQLRALHEQGRTLRRSRQVAADGTRPAPTDAQREQARQLRTQAHDVLRRVDELARRYEAPIAAALQPLAAQRAQWTADIQAIRARHATPEQQQRMAARRGHRGGQLDVMRRPARFLLLDPVAPTDQPAAASSSYPNPATGSLRLDYEVKKAGPVTVEVLDAHGTVLQTLVRQQAQDKGPHSATADVSSLPAGTYFYKITSRAGTETRRFQKQ